MAVAVVVLMVATGENSGDEQQSSSSSSLRYRGVGERYVSEARSTVGEQLGCSWSAVGLYLELHKNQIKSNQIKSNQMSNKKFDINHILLLMHVKVLHRHH